MTGSTGFADEVSLPLRKLGSMMSNQAVWLEKRPVAQSESKN